MSKSDFLALKNESLADYLRSNRFPRQYDVAKVKAMVKSDDLKPSDLHLYTYDKNDYFGVSSILELLSSLGIAYHDLDTKESSLEEIFVDLVNRKLT